MLSTAIPITYSDGYRSRGGPVIGLVLEPFEELGELAPGNPPFEQHSRLFVATLEGSHP